MVAGYGAIYTAAQMLKRPAGGQSGSVLYWITGMDSLGAPSGGNANPGSGGGTRNAKGVTAKNNTQPGPSRITVNPGNRA